MVELRWRIGGPLGVSAEAVGTHLIKDKADRERRSDPSRVPEIEGRSIFSLSDFGIHPAEILVCKYRF